MIITDPAIRKWIYGIIAAAIPILVIFGVVAAEDSQVWLNLAAAVLGLAGAGLALPNTPSRDESNPNDRVPGPDHLA